jgi:hypothetical protein
MSIRVDEGLKKRFSEVAKVKFGSTCLPVESFMAGVVGAYYQDIKLGVNPGNIVNIGEIRIERNLRARRHLDYVRCECRGCRGEAEFLVSWRGKPFRMCEKHTASYRKLKDTGSVVPLGSEKAVLEANR